jgi:hypothetical protein
MDEPADPATKAAEYKHGDGSIETVFAVDDGRVLTVREYPDVATFTDSVRTATYLGQHEGVAELSVEEFQGGD